MFIHTNERSITSFYIKRYLVFVQLAMSKRWSVIFCVTGLTLIPNWFETESILIFYFCRYKWEAAMVRSESVEAVIGRLIFSWSSSGAHFEHSRYLDIFVDMVNVSRVVSELRGFQLRSVRDSWAGISIGKSDNVKEDWDFHFFP